jgi:hypothetical protein
VQGVEFVEFTASPVGNHVYYCSVDGHQALGMEGRFIVQDRGSQGVGTPGHGTCQGRQACYPATARSPSRWRGRW